MQLKSMHWKEIPSFATEKSGYFEQGCIICFTMRLVPHTSQPSAGGAVVHYNSCMNWWNSGRGIWHSAIRGKRYITEVLRSGAVAILSVNESAALNDFFNESCVPIVARVIIGPGAILWNLTLLQQTTKSCRWRSCEWNDKVSCEKYE